MFPRNENQAVDLRVRERAAQAGCDAGQITERVSTHRLLERAEELAAGLHNVMSELESRIATVCSPFPVGNPVALSDKAPVPFTVNQKLIAALESFEHLGSRLHHLTQRVEL